MLDRLGVPYTALAHRCDERALAPQSSLERRALALARAKAESLASEYPQAFILGSDQIAEHEGTVLHKPGSVDSALRQLARMQGSAHRLLTAIALRSPGGAFSDHIDVHTMGMRSLETREIERYVQADSPLDCCGSYKIESLGITLFDQIKGDDFTAITGMPLMALASMLRNAGFCLPCPLPGDVQS